jgi:glycosyltransferase involved in cell wall biosynthesis
MVSGAEAARIERALKSVSWAADIVVVINEGVSDQTAAIATACGARVFFEPWKGFIGQKNSASDKALQPWLLNLDADEEVPPALAEEIQRVVANPNPPHPAYEFPRCSWYCGRWIRHGDWYPDRVLRLWRKGAAVWAGDEPHAKLDVRGGIGRLRSDLLHFTNLSIEHQITKIVPYSDWFVRRRESGRAPRLCQMALRPAWSFLRGYVFKLGFLDGWQGWYIAWVIAFSVATKYARLREAMKK